MKIYNINLTKDDMLSLKRGSTIIQYLENTSVKIEIKAEKTEKKNRTSNNKK